MSCDCYSCILKMVVTNFQAQLAVTHAKYNADWTFAEEALLLLKTHSLRMHRSREKSHSTCSQIDNSTVQFWQIFDCMMIAFDRLNLQNTSFAMDLLHQAYWFMIEREKYTYFTFADNIWSVSNLFPRRTAILSKEDFHDLFKATYSNPILKKQDKCTFYVQHEVLWDCMKMGKENLLCGLLKYGVMFFPVPYHDEIAFDSGHYMNVVLYLLCASRRRRFEDNLIFAEDTDCEMSDYRFCLLLRVTELLALTLKSRKEKDEKASHKIKRPRLPRSEEDGSASSSIYFRCLRRVFDTVPEPHPTSTELRKIFRFYVESQENIDELIVDFENFYPEAAGPLAPRSLQHLSRCQVRGNLRQSGTLPHGVKQLGLSTLEKYILLEE